MFFVLKKNFKVRFDASMRTKIYMKSPNRGLMGPQTSPCSLCSLGLRRSLDQFFLRAHNTVTHLVGIIGVNCMLREYWQHALEHHGLMMPQPAMTQSNIHWRDHGESGTLGMFTL